MASPNNDKRKSNSGEDNAVAIEEGVSIASSSDVGSVNSDSSDHDHSIHSTASSTSPFKEESRVISRYKLLTLIAITIAAAACGIASYFIVAGRQEDNFNLEVSFSYLHVRLLIFFSLLVISWSLTFELVSFLCSSSLALPPK